MLGSGVKMMILVSVFKYSCSQVMPRSMRASESNQYAKSDMDTATVCVVVLERAVRR